MRQLLGNLTINMKQATCIASAMQHVASSDGVHSREIEMIEGFINTCAAEEGVQPVPMNALTYDRVTIQETIVQEDQVEALIKSCYLLSLADGIISQQESACIDAIADDLKVSQEQREGWVREAKLYMLQQFEGVSLFSEQAINIGKELGLTEEEVKDALGLA